MINIIFLSLGGDIQQEGLAGYRLGNAYEEIGDPETAILVRKVLIDSLYNMQVFEAPNYTSF